MFPISLEVLLNQDDEVHNFPLVDVELQLTEQLRARTTEDYTLLRPVYKSYVRQRQLANIGTEMLRMFPETRRIVTTFCNSQ